MSNITGLVLILMAAAWTLLVVFLAIRFVAVRIWDSMPSKPLPPDNDAGYVAKSRRCDRGTAYAVRMRKFNARERSGVEG